MVKKFLPQIGVIIQARAGASRLPNKIFLPLPYNSSTTLLQQVIRRAFKINGISNLIIATTLSERDNKTEQFCIKNKISCYRGSETNVLERFYFTAKKFNLKQIIRITADNPCIDPWIISKILLTHMNNNNDYTRSQNYPIGTNVEIFTIDTLEQCYNKSSLPYEFEHVTPYIYKTAPNKFKIQYIDAIKKYHYPNLRLTVDTEEDYFLISVIYSLLYKKNCFFNLSDIIELINKFPLLKTINNNIIQKTI